MGNRRMTYNCLDCGERTTGWVTNGRRRRCRACAAKAKAAFNAEVRAEALARAATEPRKVPRARAGSPGSPDNAGAPTLVEALARSVLVSH